MLSRSKVKYIQSLGHKKFRDEEAVFIAEGPKLIAELIEENPSAIIEIFATKEWNGWQKNNAAITVTEIEDSMLERISQLTTPHEVVAIVRKFENKPIASIGFTLALDNIQDPGNLGTIIRIADWFGVSQIVCSEGSADLYNPKVVQATMGSIARVNVFYTDLHQWITQQRDVKIYATVLDGKELNSISKPGSGIILIGNESKGIDPSLLSLANVKVTIKRKGKAESLNAAVAAGIVLHHFTS